MAGAETDGRRRREGLRSASASKRPAQASTVCGGGLGRATAASVAKKRSALADLPGRSNVPLASKKLSRCSASDHKKSQRVEENVICKGKSAIPDVKRPSTTQASKQKATALQISHSQDLIGTRVISHGLASSLQTSAESLSPSNFDDSVSMCESMCTSETASSPDMITADDIASLEKKTMENLYITEPPEKEKVNQDISAADTKSILLQFIDVDTEHTDPQMCTIYANDIDAYLRLAEKKTRASSAYMEEIQEDVNENMRAILVDWLVEVAEEYKLTPDTLYLTVSYIDRYLSKNIVNRQRLQLLGVTCMLIASKYEEICAPQVEEFCYITDNTYVRDEVLQMESKVLQNLNFELSTPTTKSFLRRFVRAAQVTHEVQFLHLEFLANYLAELTLPELGFIEYFPSLVAASAVFLARFTLDPYRKPWNPTLLHYTKYQPSELKACVQAIHQLQCNRDISGLPSIREKYHQHKFKCVSKLIPPSSIPAEYFLNIQQ